MKIKLYKEAPRCPKCNSPLTYDSDELSPVVVDGVYKSGYHYIPPAKLYRCYKCGDLYKVEE